MSTAKTTEKTPTTATAPSVPVTQTPGGDPDLRNRIAAGLTSIAAGAFGVIAALHPGFHEPAAAQAVITAVSFVVAGGVQVFDIVTHRRLLGG